MKNVVISADGDRKVYSVPDVVADNLREYCIEFCGNWLINSPNAKRYRKGRMCCFNEDDFIEYLNTVLYPDKPSKKIKTFKAADDEDVPEEYRKYPYYNF